jgi:hypothetical protein
MRKLYSYLTYLGLLAFPLFFIFFAIDMNRHFEFTFHYFLMNDLILVIILAACAFAYFKYKRVYLKNSSLYIYNLFSDKLTVITYQNLVSMGRFIPLDPFNYKIVYVDTNNKTKTVFFFKNVLIFDLSSLLDEIKSNNEG